MFLSVPTISPSPTPSESSGAAFSSTASPFKILESFSRGSLSASISVGSTSFVTSTSSYMFVTFSTITIITPKPDILKTFVVTMTITNRDYNNTLGSKESEEFKRFANYVQEKVDNALRELYGFVNSTVERFSETNSVLCQLSVIFATSNIAEEMVKENLRTKLGDLKITNVEVVEKLTTPTPTEKATITKPMEGGDVFEVKMRIISEVYTEELSNSSSAKFMALSDKLTKTLTEVFKDKVEGFRHVVIIEFQKGSVICIFQVFVKKEYEVTAEHIQETLSVASENGKTGNFTFKDITVRELTMKQTGRRLKWPDWAIIVTCLCGVMLLFIIVTIFLVR